MASKPKNWYDKRAMPREPADYPDTMEALLAAECERNVRRAPTTDDDVPDSGQEGG